MLFFNLAEHLVIISALNLSELSLNPSPFHDYRLFPLLVLRSCFVSLLVKVDIGTGISVPVEWFEPQRASTSACLLHNN